MAIRLIEKIKDVINKANHQSFELEKNKQLVRNFIEDVLSRHDIAAADKYFGGQNPIRHNQQALGIEGFKEARRRYFQEFPDSHTTIDHIVAEGDKVFVMLTTTATNKRTSSRITIKSADLYRMENGIIAEHWDVVDASGMA
jgi:predicted SnoaL-like aldol condensation-catalyzing enzyme